MTTDDNAKKALFDGEISSLIMKGEKHGNLTITQR